MEILICLSSLRLPVKPNRKDLCWLRRQLQKKKKKMNAKSWRWPTIIADQVIFGDDGIAQKEELKEEKEEEEKDEEEEEEQLCGRSENRGKLSGRGVTSNWRPI